MHKRFKFLTLAFCAAVLAATSVVAAEAPEEPAATGPKAEASAAIPGTDQVIHEGATAREEAAAILKGLGMMAFIDEETGALRAPTAAEVKKLAEAGQQLRSLAAQSKLEVLTFPAETGGTAAELPAELHSVSTVTVDADGELHFGCSDASHDHNEAAAPAPARAEEE